MGQPQAARRGNNENNVTIVNMNGTGALPYNSTRGGILGQTTIKAKEWVLAAALNAKPFHSNLSGINRPVLKLCHPPAAQMRTTHAATYLNTACPTTTAKLSRTNQGRPHTLPPQAPTMPPADPVRT